MVDPEIIATLCPEKTWKPCFVKNGPPLQIGPGGPFLENIHDIEQKWSQVNLDPPLPQSSEYLI